MTLVPKNLTFWKQGDINDLAVIVDGMANGGASAPEKAMYAVGAKVWTNRIQDVTSTFQKNSRVLHGALVWIPKDTVITRIQIFATAAASAAVDVGFVCVYDKNKNKLATSANDTTLGMTVSAWNSTNLTSPWTCPADDLYYLVYLIGVTGSVNVTTNMPTVMGNALGGGNTGRGFKGTTFAYDLWWADSNSGAGYTTPPTTAVPDSWSSFWMMVAT